MTTIVPHQIIGYGMEARFASHMPSKLTEGTEWAFQFSTNLRRQRVWRGELPLCAEKNPALRGTDRQKIKGIDEPEEAFQPAILYFSLELPESTEGGLRTEEFRVSNSTVKIEPEGSHKLDVELPKSEDFL
ncbi:hypothetical protein TNCV_2285571 [Trichonephila clavipes]|nr:hypothetical protein TNCV_2285571 [Trichonephila clavipes]